jgi:hypothetical protein
VTSVLLRKLVPAVMLAETGSSLGLALRSGSPSCPFDGFTLPTASPLRSITTRSGAGFSNLLSIAYDYYVLGLGPDSPWVDWRCPGTLRLSVWRVRTASYATHSGIRTSVRSTGAPAPASPLLPNAPLPSTPPAAEEVIPSTGAPIRGVGTTLQPRYVVGAAPLDQ